VSAPPLALLPFALQGLAMGADEFGFHRMREVPRWEWAGHLLDTAVFLACLALPLALAPTGAHLRLYGALAAVSCLLITKDEWVHKRLCTALEHWTHAVLFILHPLVLLATAWMWMDGGPRGALALQAAFAGGFLALQTVAGAGRRPEIDNRIYDSLGERWYGATDDPIALLRAESRLRTGWILGELPAGSRVLDVACGAGFLANPLAAAGHRVTGIDVSLESLAVARGHDPTGTVAYLAMDARSLALPDGRFDVVCMMDFLEHLEDRDAVIREAARVLRPGGWLYFHTFNRTPLAGLVAIVGLRMFVRNTPEHMHVYHLFLKPRELRGICRRHGLAIEELRGVRPRVFSRAFLRLLATGRVADGFQFLFTPFLGMGYCGRAVKKD
jgi:2-polyprenyl-6-hydroxyphenyl methylase/3-demethylubiquinone-9 3-methyltransferase